MVYDWVIKAKKLCPEVCSWIGVYFKESYLDEIDSTDLVLGPFIGEPTEHTRIPIDRGMCGLALREERIVNLDDVHQDSRHIACSLKTKSELVIPIQNKLGEFIAELDIDSNNYSSFSKEIEALFVEHCKSFPLKEDYIPVNPKFKLETERLILRPITENDLNDIFQYSSDKETVSFVTFIPHESLEDTKKFYKFALNSYKNGAYEPLGIVLKNDPNKVVGSIGFWALDKKSFKAEFGYILAKELWGNGIMTEALKAMIDFAFTKFPFNRLQAHCMIENPGSAKVMEKAGMKFEGTFREAMLVKEKWRTLHSYSILRSEWKKNG